VIMLALIGIAINTTIDVSTRHFLPWFRREGR
jgi:hypothetical protein